MKSQIIQLKAYDHQDRLWITKPFNRNDIFPAAQILYELKYVIRAKKVYLKANRESKEIFLKDFNPGSNYHPRFLKRNAI